MESVVKNVYLLASCWSYCCCCFLNCLEFCRTVLPEQKAKLAEGSIVNLNGPDPVKGIRRVLTTGNYDLDRRDIAYIGAVLENRIESGEVFENIGELNKRDYYIPAEQAYANGGESFKKRVSLSRTLLGYDDENGVNYQQEKSRPKTFPAICRPACR